jgi:hypothetical protein
LPGASQWDRQTYENLQPDQTKTNILHFDYRRGRTKIASGKDFLSGGYSMNVTTGKIVFDENALIPEESIGFLAYDNRYVFFSDGNAAVMGFHLVSSRNSFELEAADGKKGEVRTLKKFSKQIPQYASYTLRGLSPCGHFAFIEYSEPASKESFQAAPLKKYYLVDVTTGATRLLIQDDTRKIEGPKSPEVYWIRGK